MGGTARMLSISSTLIFRSPLLQFSSKRLLSISIPLTRRVFQGFRPICSSATATTTTSAVESDSQGSSPAADKHSIIKDGGGALNTTQQAKPPNPSKNLGRNDETQNLVSDFKKLGLSEEVLAALGEMCILVPTEIQSIGIPAVLQGKSVVLGSHTGSGKTLAYLLPIVQLLRRDELEFGIQMKSMRPQAIILCPTRELSEQVFHVAKSISHHAQFRFTMVSGGGRLRPQEDSLNIPIDMVVGTPGRILQHIEDGDLVFGDIRYLVLDEADTMFDHGFGPEIHKFLDLLKNRAAKPNDTGIQTVLVAATMTKDVQELIDEEFKGISHLQTSSLHKKVSSARHDFLKLSSSENKPEVLLQVCSENNMVDAAYDLIERMEGHSLNLNEETYYVLIHGLVSASRVDKALQLFEKMHSCGVLADVRMYDVLIGELCKNNELDKALSLYSDMKSSGVSPNVGILTYLISSASEQQMVQLFEDSREYLGTESFLTLCDSILSSLVKNGLIDKAYNLLRIITEKLFNVEGIVWSKFTFFHTVMAGLCKYGKLDAALGLLRDLDKIPCEKDVTLYNDLISALSNSNRVDDCFELLREMRHLQMQPTHFTYNSIYLYFCRKSDVGGALDLVKEMRIYGHSPWIKHTTLLMKNLCNHGRALEACNFLSDIVKEGARPDIVPFSVVLEGLLKLQRLDHAVEFFKDMCSHGKRPDVIAYNILIKGFCKAKRMLEAEDMFTEMLENGLVPSTITYNSLIDGWCKNGNIEKALLCLKSIGEGVPNVVTYTTLIDGLSNVGLPDDAVSLWDEMQRKGCSPNRIAFMALINGLCKNGRPTAALNYLRQMNEMKLRADGFIYIALLSSFISKENASLAYDVLEEMVDKEITPKPEDKNHALLEDAILKLYGDPRTSSDVHSLLASGAIPTISLTELQKRSEPLT